LIFALNLTDFCTEFQKDERVLEAFEEIVMEIITRGLVNEYELKEKIKLLVYLHFNFIATLQ